MRWEEAARRRSLKRFKTRVSGFFIYMYIYSVTLWVIIASPSNEKEAQLRVHRCSNTPRVATVDEAEKSVTLNEREAVHWKYSFKAQFHF